MRRFNKIAFALNTSFKTIFSVPWLSLVMVLALMVTFIMPLLHISSIENGKKLAYSRDKNISFDYRISFVGRSNNNKLIVEDYFNDISFVEKSRIQAMSIREFASVNDELILLNIIGVDNNFFESDQSIVKGRFPNKTEIDNRYNVCVVSLTFANKYALSIGDSLKFRGREFEIIGVSVKAYSVPTILIALNHFEDTDVIKDYKYTVDFWLKDKAEKSNVLSEVSSRVKFGMGTNLDIKDFKEAKYEEDRRRRKYFDVLINETLSIIVLSCFSTLLVMGGYFLNKQKLYGIKLAIGASFKQILFEMIYELSLYSIVAMLIDIFIIKKFTHVFSWVIEMHTNANFILTGILFAFVFSVLIATIICLLVIKKQPARLIKG